MKNIAFGQYYHGNSFLHRLDPRTKFLLAILYLVCSFLASGTISFALLLLSAFILILVSRIPFRIIFGSIRAVLVIMLVVALFNVFGYRGVNLLFSIPIGNWSLNVYEEGLWRAGYTLIRILCMIIGTGIFMTYTTTPIALTDAIEQLFSFLRVFHVPVHDFAMILSIALRFIPSIIEETDTIMAAQKSRGADYEGGGLIQRTKALIPVIIPLFASQFRRAYDLAVAMICRCYRGGKGKTRLRVLKFRFSDYLMLALMVAFGTCLVLCNVYLGHIGYLMK